VAEGLPADVSRFIDAYITSVEQIEALLVLKADPDIARSPGNIAKRLYTSEESIDVRLAELEAHGLIARSGDDYVYRPRAEELSDGIERLAEFYAKRKVAVINQVFAGPADEVQSFADAFRLRKDKD
jgi:DNA-binding MarR family transcriptional regulator